MVRSDSTPSNSRVISASVYTRCGSSADASEVAAGAGEVATGAAPLSLPQPHGRSTAASLAATPVNTSTNPTSVGVGVSVGIGAFFCCFLRRYAETLAQLVEVTCASAAGFELLQRPSPSKEYLLGP